MASPSIAARTVAPQLEVWTNVPRKSKSPYGIPIVDDCSDCNLHSADFFCGLSDAALRALQRIKHTTTYPTGAIIFMEGQPSRGVHILCQGRVKLQTTNSDGRTLILKIAQPGEALGLSSTITGRPYETTAEILQPAQLAFIARGDFLRFMAEHGDACLHFVEHLSRDCHAAYELVRSIGLSESVSERLARFLLEWSANGSMSNGVLRVKLALTHQEMAQLIGTSRETVTRTLSEFKKQGVIELNGSTMVLRNKATLEHLAAA
jgi:CRP/FNR family transcriptional regulator, cyclic AMP receptor protein